jgi:hypothetical protein
MRIRLIVMAAALGLVVASSAQAAHHLWSFSSMFSNASGSVQYVEMICGNDNNENALGTFTITTGTNTLHFVTNLPNTNTANTWLLCATSGFQSLPGGVIPDYIIPSNFFPTGGGTLNYASGTSTWGYGTVPTDGVLMLKRNGSTATNTPHNFAGAVGSVNLTPTVPMLPTWGLALAVGALLLLASGLLRKRETHAA